MIGSSRTMNAGIASPDAEPRRFLWMPMTQSMVPTITDVSAIGDDNLGP